jgi:DNA repair protein RecO (recombination protein O)
MPLKQSEAIVLRTYPLREADLLVTLFTRAEGKVKGVAKSAKRSRKRFGGALEPLTCVRALWQDSPKTDLARLDSCDVLLSPLSSPLGHARLVALSHVAEMLDELLPDREPSDAVFRLAWSVLQALQAGPIWLPVAYFDLWMLRLLGFLPSLDECIDCSAALTGQPAYFHAMRDGLVCARHRHIASSEMSLASRSIAALIFRNPVERMVDQVGAEPVPVNRLADLRKFLMQIIHRHLDRRLQTPAQLDRLD